IIVVLGWVLFRANNLAQAMEYYSSMMKFDFNAIYLDKEVLTILLIAIVLSTACIFKFVNKAYTNFVNSTSLSFSILKSLLSFVLILVSVSALLGSDFNPFIYFRF